MAGIWEQGSGRVQGATPKQVSWGFRGLPRALQCRFSMSSRRVETRLFKHHDVWSSRLQIPNRRLKFKLLYVNQGANPKSYTFIQSRAISPKLLTYTVFGLPYFFAVEP